MRRCKIVTWAVILSNINFALGAPVAVRDRLKMSVDVDVKEGGTTTSQKRNDPLDSDHLGDDWSTSNVADRPPTPPSPYLSDLEGLWEKLGEKDIVWHFPPTSESPGSKSGSVEVESDWRNYGPSNPGSPTGSDLGLTGGSPLPPHPAPSEGRFPSPAAWLVNPDTLSSTDRQPAPPLRPTGDSPLPAQPSEDRFPSPAGLPANPDTLSSTGHQPMPPQSPTGGPLHALSHPEDHFPSTPGWSADLNPDTLLSTGYQLTPPQSPTGGSPLPHPGSSEDRSPSPHCWLAEQDTLSSIGSQPTPPQSTTAMHPPPGPGLSPDEFLDNLLKGKIRRRVYCESAPSIRRRGTQGQQISPFPSAYYNNDGYCRGFDRFLNFPRRRDDANTFLRGLTDQPSKPKEIDVMWSY